METHIENPPPTDTNGMNRLVQKYRRQFRIPENLDYYAEGDYQLAERKYLRFCLQKGSC